MPETPEMIHRDEVNAIRQFVETRGWQRVRERLEQMARDEQKSILSVVLLDSEKLTQTQVLHLARYRLLLEVLDIPRLLETQVE